MVIALIVAQSNGKIILLGKLLGLSEGIGPGAQAYERYIVKAQTASAHGAVGNFVAGVYGSPSRGLAVVAGRTCGTCIVNSGSNDLRAARARGFADVRLFPPGPGGGVLECYSNPAQVPGAVDCNWFSSNTSGQVEFSGGFASSLADAAAKTVQIRAAIG